MGGVFIGHHVVHNLPIENGVKSLTGGKIMWATILGTLIFYELGCVLEESHKRK